MVTSLRNVLGAAILATISVIQRIHELMQTAAGTVCGFLYYLLLRVLGRKAVVDALNRYYEPRGYHVVDTEALESEVDDLLAAILASQTPADPAARN